MNIGDAHPQRHPSEATLLAYAAGNLGVAHQLVVAVHAEHCGDCRGMIRFAERVGGLLMSALRPGQLKPKALELCLAKLDTPAAVAAISGHEIGRPRDQPAPQVGGVMLPNMLRGLRPGRLRWLAPGIRQATLYRDDSETLHFIRVDQSVSLPEHKHRGLELTCVLRGSFHDGNGQYLAGDVAEEDEADEQDVTDHLVSADPPGDCVCIMAVSGRLEFKSRLARLLQPIMPF